MFRSTKRAIRASALLFALFLIILNVFVVASPLLGLVGLLVFLSSVALPYGRAFLPGQTLWAQRATGAMVVIALFSLFGSAIYYAGPVSPTSLLVLTVLIGLVGTLLGLRSPTQQEDDAPEKHGSIFFLAIGILIGLGAWWSSFATIQITDSVRSVWHVIDPRTLLAIALVTFLLTIAFSYRRGGAISIPLLGATLFSVIALAAVVFPLGYGFDPFIHRATVAHIATFGSISPKPYYYIGQYALELTSLHVFTLPLAMVDRLLVPLLTAFMVTASAVIGFSRAIKGRRYVALLCVLLLPLSAFIVTTPQALAYVFTATLLFLSIPRLLQQERSTPLATLGIFTAAALITHPLAGIPAAIYYVLVAIATAGRGFERTRFAATTLVALLGSISLPVVFIWQSRQSETPMTFTLAHLFDLSRVDVTFFFHNHYDAWLDLLYLAFDNLLWILMLFSAIGAFLLIKQRAVKTIHLPLLAGIMWFVNFWLLSTTVEFQFLIEYERTNYAIRLLTLTSLFLLPHVGFAFAFIEEHLWKKPRALFAVFAGVISLLVTANVYGAYPRHDNYARSAGFNVTSVDQDAVWSIEKQAEPGTYVVLANQAVSAAALEAFGFTTYFHEDIFYYPIPTGGELYQIYLSMADSEPSRLNAQKAMDLTGVDVVYFVINDYWWQSEVIIEHAKKEADDWWSVGDGAVTIFVYQRSVPE